MGKLSSDRLLRVKQCENLKESLVLNKSIKNVGKNDYITVGDWCLFHKAVPETGGSIKSLIGMVLDFAYLNQKTWRQTEYAKSFVNISDLKKKMDEIRKAQESKERNKEKNGENNEDDDGEKDKEKNNEAKILGVLCLWFHLIDHQRGLIETSKMKFHGYIDVCQYNQHLPEPRKVKLRANPGPAVPSGEGPAFGVPQKLRPIFQLDASTFQEIKSFVTIVEEDVEEEGAQLTEESDDSSIEE